MENFPLPANCWAEGGMNRINFYNFYDLLDAKKHAYWIHKAIKLQRLLGVKRTVASYLPPLFGGSTYWSLNREAVETVDNYTLEHPKLLKRLKHTFCAEEIYIQTILMNSPLEAQIESDNLRMIKWTEQNISSPSILNEEDFSDIKQSDHFFVRKLDINNSKHLKLLIDEWLHVT